MGNAIFGMLSPMRDKRPKLTEGTVRLRLFGLIKNPRARPFHGDLKRGWGPLILVTITLL